MDQCHLLLLRAKRAAKDQENIKAKRKSAEKEGQMYIRGT